MNCLKDSLPANADLSSSQYCMVSVNSSGYVAATGDGARADAVLQDKPAAQGRAAELITAGRTLIKTGGSFSAAAELGSDSTGRAVDAATGDVVNAVALEASTGANQYVWCLFSPKGEAATS